MKYFFDDDVSNKIAALHVMRNMPALFTQAAPAIVDIGRSSNDTSVTYYIYSALSAMGLEEDHIDMYLDNIARGAYRQNIKNISVFSREKEVLGNVSQYAVLGKVFAFWEQHKELLFSDVLGVDAMFAALMPLCKRLQLIDTISSVAQVDEYPHQFMSLLFDEYKATNNVHYLSLLIQANYRNAVEAYYQLAHAQNAIPDYSEGDNVPVLTESIKEVRDPALTPLLIQLLKLSMQEGFIDKDMFGLNWACRQALRAIAMHDTEVVLQELETAKEPYNQSINQLLIDLSDNFSYYLVNSADEALDFDSALMIVPLRTATS